MRRKIGKIGPFSYVRVKNRRKNFLSIVLTCLSDFPFGWSWGTDEELSNPSFCIRLAHFNVFSYERLDPRGWLLFVLGFWTMR
jgi:hypothetical protein